MNILQRNKDYNAVIINQYHHLYPQRRRFDPFQVSIKSPFLRHSPLKLSVDLNNLRPHLRSSNHNSSSSQRFREISDFIFVETMSTVFEGYERQYCELSSKLSKLCTAAAALNGEQKKQNISDIKAGIDEAEALIRKMDLEARSLQPNIKGVLLAKLREYKSDLNNNKSELKKLVSGNMNPSARDMLLESGMADAMTVSADQRDRLMFSTERLNKSSDRIKDSRRTMLETEELGVSILQDLHSQRQSLLHAHDTLHGVDDNVSKSKKILSNMSKRMNRNKCIISTIVAVLVLVIMLTLYFKLSK
ncbi:vesicle transport V-SNARE protein amino-terminal protein [Medicago truncatula]|uniref:Vesicle transport V-SNARE protein amino-terminal protein n=2 Tax=Medicago truncatula TaxID=3880 RepID=G7L326_MEDTR|nr:vesicle transport V-SNARE protein amino-terminal protein [Medicago truncatula]